MKYPITNKWGETVEPSGDIRERIAAALYAAKPSGYELSKHYDVRLRDPVGWYLYNFPASEREKFSLQWADYLLVALDKVGLQLTEINEDVERW